MVCTRLVSGGQAIIMIRAGVFTFASIYTKHFKGRKGCNPLKLPIHHSCVSLEGPATCNVANVHNFPSRATVLTTAQLRGRRSALPRLPARPGSGQPPATTQSRRQ